MARKVFYDEEYKDLKKEMRSLAMYNKRAYKQIIFKENLRELTFTKLNDTEYFSELITDKLFEKVYGVVKLIVEMNDDKILVKRIEPEEIFLAGYRKILDTYKGVPYRNEKDLFKIKTMEGIKNGNN